jgi:tetratricopeptide (TPR) repeat protein
MGQFDRREGSPEGRRVNFAAMVSVCVAALLLASAPAFAASRESKERAARMACLAGDYTKGVAILSQLFVDSGDPNYIYNQGRCFEQNTRYQDAIARFQEFVRVGKKSPEDDKAAAQKHIADCEALLAKQTRPSEAAAAPPARVQAPEVAPVPPIVQTTRPSPASEPGSGLRTAGVIAASLGGAALVTGVILNLKVNSMASDFQSLNGYTDGKESDRKTYQSLGWVSYGVGAACVATGAVLYYLGARAGKHGSTSVALLPAFAPGGALAVMKGAF